MYKSKITLEVTIDHQFDPDKAADAIKYMLKVPAISDIKILSINSNYRLHEEPLERFIKHR